MNGVLFFFGMCCLIGGLVLRWGWGVGLAGCGALLLFPFIMEEIRGKSE